jgi:hypothetical protein
MGKPCNMIVHPTQYRIGKAQVKFLMKVDATGISAKKERLGHCP